METHGRKVIFANYTEEQLLGGTLEQKKAKILDIMENSIPLHELNKSESKYLQDYLYGIQDIRYKEKLTRTDINNKGVENWAFAFCDWKKAFLLGKPIQYAPLNDTANEEISLLNKFMTYEDKDNLDQEIYEDMFTCGRGFRYVNYSKVTEDDESPIEMLNFNTLNTEVVYSSAESHEQLLAFVEIQKMAIVQEVNPITGQRENVNKNYSEYNVYLKNMKCIVDNKLGKLRIVEGSIKPIIHNCHLITEYYLNRRRMGLLEIAKDIFDDINNVENLDLDDIQGFVNSIMVFTNAEIDENGMNAIKQYGAVSIKSTDQKKASIELLQSRLKSLDTQIYYLRKLSALHSILSVPQATNSGEVSNAETGKAVLTGQGFTSASVRVENEEKAFKKCDRNALRTALKILKNVSDGEIKVLKVSDIEIKFSRDLSDNLLVKTQALLNLTTCNIPPEIRNTVIGLFSDPLAVTKMQEAFEKERQALQEQLKQSSNNENKINENNNKTQDTLEIQNQEQ